MHACMSTWRMRMHEPPLIQTMQVYRARGCFDHSCHSCLPMHTSPLTASRTCICAMILTHAAKQRRTNNAHEQQDSGT